MTEQKKMIVEFSVLSAVFLALGCAAVFLPDPLVFDLKNGYLISLAPFGPQFFSTLFIVLFAAFLVAAVVSRITLTKKRDRKLSVVTQKLVRLRSQLTRVTAIKNYVGVEWHTVLLQQMRYKLIERYDGIIASCDELYELRLDDIDDTKNAQFYTTVVNQTENIRAQIELMKSALFFSGEDEALKELMDSQKRAVVNGHYIQNIDDMVLEAFSAGDKATVAKQISSYKRCVMQEEVAVAVVNG